jgi:hypothetical protein
MNRLAGAILVATGTFLLVAIEFLELRRSAPGMLQFLGLAEVAAGAFFLWAGDQLPALLPREKADDQPPEP